MQTSIIINDQDRLNLFDAVFVDWMGGEHVMDVVFALMCGRTYSEIEQLHGVPRSTAHGWVTECKMKLRRAGFDMEEIERKAAMISFNRHATPAP